MESRSGGSSVPIAFTPASTYIFIKNRSLIVNTVKLLCLALQCWTFLGEDFSYNHRTIRRWLKIAPPKELLSKMVKGTNESQ
jgi:hypothetical protein